MPCALPCMSCQRDPLQYHWHAWCRLTQLVQNGPFPPAGETGARYIIRADGRRLDLKFLTKESDRHLEVNPRTSSCLAAS